MTPCIFVIRFEKFLNILGKAFRQSITVKHDWNETHPGTTSKWSKSFMKSLVFIFLLVIIRRLVSLCPWQCVPCNLLRRDCVKTVCSPFVLFQDRMEHHGYDNLYFIFLARIYWQNVFCFMYVSYWKPEYSQSSPCNHSRKRPVLIGFFRYVKIQLGSEA